MNKEEILGLLLSKPALIVDDGIPKESAITNIKRNFENMGMSFVVENDVPDEIRWGSIDSVSFAILDWQLKSSKLVEGQGVSYGATALETEASEELLTFIEHLTQRMIPVYIFTQENVDYINSKLREKEATKKAFEQKQIATYSKSEINNDRIVEIMWSWYKDNPAVYLLKKIERSLNRAKDDYFKRMSGRNNLWPVVVCSTLEKDGSEDIQQELTEFVLHSLITGIKTPQYDLTIFNSEAEQNDDEIIQIYSEAKLISYKEQPTQIYSGDLYISEDKKKYCINITPECDLRNKKYIFLPGTDEKKYNYSNKTGLIQKNITHCIPLLCNSIVVEFQFADYFIRTAEEEINKELSISDGENVIRYVRVGRIIHPYLTEIQERFGHYISRHGNIRHPDQILKKGTT